jgi:hypothetical protein
MKKRFPRIALHVGAASLSSVPLSSLHRKKTELLASTLSSSTVGPLHVHVVDLCLVIGHTPRKIKRHGLMICRTDRGSFSEHA